MSTKCKETASTTQCDNGGAKKLCVPAIPSWSVLASHLQEIAGTTDAIADAPSPTNLILHETEPKQTRDLRESQPIDILHKDKANEEDRSGDQTYTTFGLILMVILPIVVMCLCYVDQPTQEVVLKLAYTSIACVGIHYAVSYVVDHYRINACKNVEDRINQLVDLVVEATKVVRVAEAKARGGNGRRAMSIPLARIEFNRVMNGNRCGLQCLPLRQEIIAVLDGCSELITDYPAAQMRKKDALREDNDILLVSIAQKAKVLQRQQVPLFIAKRLHTLRLVEVRNISTAVNEMTKRFEARMRLDVRAIPEAERPSNACQLPTQFKFLLQQIADGLREAQSDVHRCYDDVIHASTVAVQLRRLQSYHDELELAMTALSAVQADMQLTIARHDEHRRPAPTKQHKSPQPLPPSPFPAPSPPVAQAPSKAPTPAAQPEDITLVFQETVEPLAEMPYQSRPTSSEHPAEEAELETQFMGELVEVLKHRSPQLPPERCKSGKSLKEVATDIAGTHEEPVQLRSLSHTMPRGDSSLSNTVTQARSICVESPTLLQELQRVIQSSHVEAEG